MTIGTVHVKLHQITPMSQLPIILGIWW